MKKVNFETIRTTVINEKSAGRSFNEIAIALNKIYRTTTGKRWTGANLSNAYYAKRNKKAETLTAAPNQQTTGFAAWAPTPEAGNLDDVKTILNMPFSEKMRLEFLNVYCNNLGKTTFFGTARNAGN